MSTKGLASWYRTEGRITTGDLLGWTDVMQEEFGYWVKFQFAPPLPRQRHKVWGCVTVYLSRWCEGGLESRIASVRTVKHCDIRPLETIYLEMISELAMALDRGDWDWERAMLDR